MNVMRFDATQLFQLVQTKLPNIVEIVLAILFAWFVAGVFLADKGEFLEIEKSENARSDNSYQGVDVAVLLAGHLFGDNVVVTPKQSMRAKIEKVVLSKLDIKLVGTVVSDKMSVAMMVAKTGASVEMYYTGDEILPTVILEEVFLDHVLLDVAGKKESLWLEKDVESKIKASINVSDKPIEVKHIHLSRSLVTQAMQNMPKVLKQIRAIPHFSHGKADGFLLSDLQVGSVFETMGLKNGDIFQTVNGKPVANVGQAMMLYQQLKTANSVDISLLRNGREISVRYQVQ